MNDTHSHEFEMRFSETLPKRKICRILDSLRNKNFTWSHDDMLIYNEKQESSGVGENLQAIQMEQVNGQRQLKLALYGLPIIFFTFFHLQFWYKTLTFLPARIREMRDTPINVYVYLYIHIIIIHIYLIFIQHSVFLSYS